MIDVIMSAWQKTIGIEQKDGTITKEQYLDEDILWWKTGPIASPTFGRMAYVLKEWERKALSCLQNMCPERAQIYGQEIMEIANSYRRSIDAKSSESLRDKNNSMSTLIDKINKNKVERVYTMKDQMKKSLIDKFYIHSLYVIIKFVPKYYQSSYSLKVCYNC